MKTNPHMSLDATLGLALTIQGTTMFTLDMRLTVALEGGSTHSHFTDEEIKGRSHLERVMLSDLISTL